MKKINFLVLLVIITLISCHTKKTTKTISEVIRLNQIGYYPTSVKEFIVADMNVTTFSIVDENNDVVFSGEMKNNGLWDGSGETILLGDFSEFNKEGNYKIQVDDSIQSYPFEIKKEVYSEALNAAIKSYYYQRASMPIEEQYAGVYKREAGLNDLDCKFHPSSGLSEGVLNSPGGWFDAGDYGKYIVNAALSVGQMLHFVEQYPNAIPDGTLNIPESGNGVNDLWDELRYELDWMLTMQDNDGGVFHKLTAKNFSGFMMPNEFDLERMIIGKGTAATLDFAAVLSQASRLYKRIDPEWSKVAFNAAQKAWGWAVANPNVAYSNPEDVSTGAYDDTVFTDEFYWAATELFLASKDKEYLNYLNENKEEYIHELTNSWKFFIRNNAFHSLLENKDVLNEELKIYVTQGQLKLADEILVGIENNPYNIALERFEWGSNSDILNQAMILCVTHRLTGDEKYLNGVQQITDYIFGKNATGYSFLTGFGSKKVMFPHHRPSGADGIVDPVPGFIAGGPNKDIQDKGYVTYTSEFPAKSFEDVEASFASNEVCLNWNAPAVFVLGYLEQNCK